MAVDLPEPIRMVPAKNWSRQTKGGSVFEQTEAAQRMRAEITRAEFMQASLKDLKLMEGTLW